MSMMFARRRMPLFTLLFLFVLGSVNATCYYPNGDTDDGHRVCDPNASGGSTCCAEGFGCMSNGLCADLRYENFQRVLRGGCSDKDFGGSCNSVCTEYWPQGDEAVFYCSSGKYCCGRSDDCCSDSSVEKHDLGEPVVIATAGKTVPKATTSAKQPSSTANENTPTTLATSNVPEGVQVSNNQDNKKGSSNTVAIAVGVGVGVGVVLFLILAAGCWFMRSKKRRERKNNQISELMDQHYENGGGNPFSRGTTAPRPLAAINGRWWRGSRQVDEVHEMDGDRGIELAANGEPKEIGGAERQRRESQIYMMSGDEKHLGPASRELESEKPKDKENKT